MGFSGPVFGAMSDALRSRWGRRRPFILIGQLGCCLGLWLMMVARSFWMFTAAFSLYVLGNNCATSVFSTVLPELVPASQRGTAGGFFTVFQTLGNLSAFCIGFVVGDSRFKFDSADAYALLIAINLLDIVVGVISVGQTPGWCSPEAVPSAIAKSSQLPFAHGRRTGSRCCKRMGSFLESFCQGWGHKPFLFMFFYMLTIASVGTVGHYDTL
eukprot:SAG31_NODE_1442_length_8325_cov_5.564916_2_plen_213_part_00